MEHPTFREAVENCRYCFMCRHAGTAFRATKRDALTARGRALQLSAVLEGFSDWTKETAEIAYADPVDGLCRELCAYHWPEDEVLRKSRGLIVDAGLVPAPVAAAMSEITAEREGDWRPDPARTAGANDVLYLSGWAARRYGKDIIDSQLRVLDAGYGQVGMLPDETATAAAAAYDLGYFDEAAALSEGLVRAIRARRPGLIVTGCSHTLRVLHGETGGPDLSEAMPVLHLVEVIGRLVGSGKIQVKKLTSDGRTAVHDAEHLARTRRLSDEPRALVDLCLTGERVEFEHSRAVAESAGAGAALFVTYPDLTRTIAGARVRQAFELGIDRIVTSCPHCYIAFGALQAEGLMVEDISQVVCRAAGLH